MKPAAARARNLVVVCALALAACASLGDMNAALKRLEGAEVKAALDLFGSPDEQPTGEAADDASALYSWTNVAAASDVFGGRMIVAPVSCKIEIAAAPNGAIVSARMAGEYAACRRWEGPLRAFDGSTVR